MFCTPAGQKASATAGESKFLPYPTHPFHLHLILNLSSSLLYIRLYRPRGVRVLYNLFESATRLHLGVHSLCLLRLTIPGVVMV